MQNIKNILKVKLLFGLTFCMQEKQLSINTQVFNLKLYKQEDEIQLKKTKYYSASQAVIKLIQSSNYNYYYKNDNTKLPIYMDENKNMSINFEKLNNILDVSKLTYYQWDKLNFHHRKNMDNFNLNDIRALKPEILMFLRKINKSQLYL